MAKEKDESRVYLELPNCMIELILGEFDTDIDTDDLCLIHHHNVSGEILTSSILLNRVGNKKAEFENILSETKLRFEIQSAHIKEKKRKELTFESLDSKGMPKISKPTVDEVENAYVMSPDYKVMKQEIFKAQKNLAYIDSLYWSVKDKCDKVQKLFDKQKPEDFEKELIEERINGVMIKLKGKSIK